MGIGVVYKANDDEQRQKKLFYIAGELGDDVQTFI